MHIYAQIVLQNLTSNNLTSNNNPFSENRTTERKLTYIILYVNIFCLFTLSPMDSLFLEKRLLLDVRLLDVRQKTVCKIRCDMGECYCYGTQRRKDVFVHFIDAIIVETSHCGVSECIRNIFAYNSIPAAGETPRCDVSTTCGCHAVFVTCHAGFAIRRNCISGFVIRTTSKRFRIINPGH